MIVSPIGKRLSPAETGFAVPFWRGLMPDPRLKVSEWADRYRWLPQVGSAEPGQWDTERTPYLKEIMDSLSVDSPVQFVILMKGSQIGATETGCNWMGYVIDHAPGPMLVIYPSAQTGARSTRQRFDPLFEMPRIREKLADAKDSKRAASVSLKEFPGGMLAMASAKSSADLRSMPIRYLFGDEIDEWDMSAGGQGDTVEQALRGTRTFTHRRKVFLCSTPTFEGRSHIGQRFSATDRRYYHVPCPKCGHFQRLVWRKRDGSPGGIKYSGDRALDIAKRAESAYYECEQCQVHIDEWRKTEMLANGIWVPEDPTKPKTVRGYHISALYSPDGWWSWPDCVEQFLKGQVDPNILLVFVNQTLGEVWRDEGDAPEWESIYNRRERYKFGTVPEGVVFITVGVDVQDDRLEAEVVGWGRDKQSWSIDYQVFSGDPKEMEVWVELDRLLHKQYPHDFGVDIPIRRLAIDTGGSCTTDVYAWCRTRRDRVMAIKGGHDDQRTILGLPKAVDVLAGGRRYARGLKLWMVGQSLLKRELYGLLRLPQPTHPERDGYPPGYCHFPEWGDDFFKQLTAEERVVRTRGTRRTVTWEKVRHSRNEVLDCRVYARAAASAVGLDRWEPEDWDEEIKLLRGTLEGAEKVHPRARPRRARSR